MYPEYTPDGGVAGPGNLAHALGDAAQRSTETGILVALRAAEGIAARRAKICIAMFYSNRETKRVNNSFLTKEEKKGGEKERE